MNIGMIRYLLGRVLMILGILLLVPILIALIFREPFRDTLSFLASSGISLGVGYLLSFRKPKNEDIYAQEGLVMVALAWFAMSFFGALPFVFSASVPSLVDALFESFSGFTTTGASVLYSSLHIMPKSLLFWRSFTLLIGGMGMLVFLIQVLPTIGAKGIYIMRAELPGPNFGKLESKVSSSVLILNAIIIGMTLVMVVALKLCGIPWFDSVLLALGTAGTGGFDFFPNSVAHYGNPAAEIVLTVGMFTFAMSYLFFYLIFTGKIKQVLKSEELHWYLAIILISILFISLNVFPLYENISTMFRDVSFTVTSVMSTTAYRSVNFNVWPVVTHVVLLFLMFSGGMSGSTSSGLKVARIAVFVKSIRQEMRRMVSPDRAVPIKYDGKQLGRLEQRSIAFYLMTYLGLFAILLLLVSWDTKTFSSAFTGVIATLNNVGSGLDLLGPSIDYSELHARTKLIMCVAMVMGRLEIYPVLILFSRHTWRKT